MDELDAGLLREMLREQVLIWGGIEPRLRTTELADRLDVDRTTVWSRLRAWEEQGFLVGQEVLPNPSLFGAGIAGGDIRIDDPRQKAQALEALQLVDGVLYGFDMLGPYVLVAYAQETQAGLDRCLQLVSQLPEVDEVSMCVPFEPPGSQIEPTSLDWRLIDALRSHPDAPLGEVADHAGISRRTFTRRYGELLDAQALWSFPLFDFSRYRGAVLARYVVLIDDPARSSDVVNACQDHMPLMLWSESLDSLASNPEIEQPWVDAYCQLDTAAEAEDLQRWLLDQPGVDEVEVYFPRRWFVVPAWFDERIERELKRGTS